MKLLEFKQFNNSDEEKSLNKKKVAVTISIAALILIIAIIIIAYITNASFRNFMDKYILFKHVDENDLPSISIESENNLYTCAFYNYVAVLENNNLKLYNSSGKQVENFEVNINTPIFATQDNYLVIAEKGQQRLYVFKDKKMIWNKEVEGQISRVNVNENGYVSVIVTGTSYKSVITTYTENGTELFKTFLSNTVAIDVDVSKDNKYLSFCEMDLAGTLIESKVKTISIEKAKQDPANAIIHTYEIPVNSLVTNLEYHEKDDLICMCDLQVYKLKNGMIETLASLDENEISFVGVKLSKSYFTLTEEKFGINNQKSILKIYNTSNKKLYQYNMEGIAKDVCAEGGVIAVNLGTEAYFINENGWLIKKYTSSQEIKDIVISNHIAGIIYRNKIVFMIL